jgi:hypothetical protein
MAGDLVRVRIDRDPIPRSFNEPDKVREDISRPLILSLLSVCIIEC